MKTIELHGWVTIRETYEVNFEKDNKDIFVDKIKKKLKIYHGLSLR